MKESTDPEIALNRMFDGDPGHRLVAGEKFSRVVGDAGKPLQPGVVVEQVILCHTDYPVSEYNALW
jgi:hypothetical protein